jgi:hypothetical protein
MIPLKGVNYYLKNLYESPNAMDIIPNIYIKDEVFLEEIDLGLRGYQKRNIKTSKANKLKYKKLEGLSSSLMDKSS